jgi:uncharacterized protein
MPIPLTYPGVYIEELPSGVRTITGVATSITAFIGRTLRGPVNKAITINSWGDFERTFGGLWLESTLSYAVRDYYLNGGSQAIIVRLYHPFYESESLRKNAEDAALAVAESTTGNTPAEAAGKARTKALEYQNEPEKAAADKVAKAAEAAAAVQGATIDSVKAAASRAAARRTKAKLAIDGIALQAAFEGSWGNNLRAKIDLDISEDVAKQMGLAKTDLFNLTVINTGTSGSTERFINLSVKNSSRRIDKVLDAESRLVRFYGTLPTTTPTAADDTITTAEQTLNVAEKNLQATKKEKPQDQPTIDLAQKAVDDARSALSSAKDEMEACDGDLLTKADDFTPADSESNKRGLYALEQADLFNLLCIPPYSTEEDVDVSLISDAAAYCEKKRAMLLVDPPNNWDDKTSAKTNLNNQAQDKLGTRSRNAALFFPRLKQPNPLRDNQMEEFVPCGTVAGVFARTDSQRGVWKAPAGLDASLIGVPQLSYALTDGEIGELNPLGINCLRSMPAVGRVIWGSRTLQGDDRLASEWKYIPVRRTALFLEESLYRGSQWVVFEPNDEPLWAQIRLNIGAFMHNLFRQGAFQGKTPSEAYYVKCDKETTTQTDINLGIVNIVVGFAPLKPAEFVVIKIQQMAGQIQS